MYKKMSQLGRALMLPIAVLPAAGLLLGIGSAFSNDTAIAIIPFLGSDAIQTILNVMKIAGNAVFTNIGLLFALGIAVGFAKEDKGTAGISAGISYMVALSVIAELITLLNIQEKIDTGVLGGLIIGGGVATLHNKFHKIKLPEAIGFFGGNRFVPIISSVYAILVSFLLALIWPPIMQGLTIAGQGIATLGPLGSFIYGASMRLFGAVGLHHAIYPMFWYTELGGSEIVNGDTVAGAQNIFFAQLADPNHEGLFTYGTRFFAGRFATMMFGIPAAALAMYHSIPKKYRKKSRSLYSSGALTSFLTGITEPIEYCFLFVAPWLYVIHALLDGLSFLVADILCIRIGNAFAAGLFDYTLFGVLQGNASTNWILVIPVGIVWAAIYYIVFRACIKIGKVPIMGMDGNIDIDNKEDINKNNTPKIENNNSKDSQAAQIIEALGNKDNITEVDSCATRLRVSVNDSSKVNESKLKSTGAIAVINKGGGVQVVYGVKANLISGEVKSALEEMK